MGVCWVDANFVLEIQKKPTLLPASDNKHPVRCGLTECTDNCVNGCVADVLTGTDFGVANVDKQEGSGGMLNDSVGFGKIVSGPFGGRLVSQ